MNVSRLLFTSVTLCQPHECFSFVILQVLHYAIRTNSRFSYSWYFVLIVIFGWRTQNYSEKTEIIRCTTFELYHESCKLVRIVQKIVSIDLKYNFPLTNENFIQKLVYLTNLLCTDHVFQRFFFFYKRLTFPPIV